MIILKLITSILVIADWIFGVLALIMLFREMDESDKQEVLMNISVLSKRKMPEYMHSSLLITCGYGCINASQCDKSNKCKYRDKYRFHNFSVKLSRFFKKFNIDFHLPVYIQRYHVELSGTTKCPYNKDRMYSCLNCIYGSDYPICSNIKRNHIIDSGNLSAISYDDPDKSMRCKLFEPNEDYYYYDGVTGEYL